MPNYIVQKEDVLPICSRGGEIKVLISPKTVESTQLILGISVIPVGGSVLMHAHDYSEEAFYVIKGQGNLYLEGIGTLPFIAGSAVRVPKEVPHSIENTGNVDLEVVFISAPLDPVHQAGHREIETAKVGS